ncbi:MAG TPA: DEAD/DEAH box helicase [Plasticicumulans sp.]|nr:DEAD/DEAH box helicase [Plasticicumulans sp.]
MQWQTDPGGGTRLAFVAGPPADAVLPLSPPWYVDAQAGCCGPLSTTLPPALAGALASAPVLEAEDIDPLNDWLERHLPGVALPRPPRLQVATEADFRPQPRLRLYSRELGAAPAAGIGRGTRSGTGLVDGVHLDFGYGDAHWLDWHDDTPVISRLRADRVVERIARRRDLERAAIERLYDADLIALRNLSWAAERLPRSCRHDFGFHDPDRWADFVLGELPRLRAEGWRIEIEPGFRYDLAEPGEWFAELDESGGEDWFGLALGVELDGERVNLLPCLVELLARLPGGDARSWLAQLGDERRVMVPLPDGRLLPVPAARIRKILAVLVELYDGEGLNLRGKLSLARSQATRLAELEAALGDRTLTWHGGERLRTLLTELRRGPQPVAVPEGFHAQLRPYQQQGLEWLQFLRVTQLAGVLADDMGLGKTVQTLAHIACEHAAGRLDRPVLIVAPTSLLPNWRDEAARFAPRLRVLALRGPDRARDFARIPEHDLVLTTYALLPRDREALARHTYHLLILDEAQAIKNPTAQAGIVARALRARHRLCLTGTPMENHLGELWSLFDFLLPGLLGDARQFQRSFRKPIEKDGDRERRERLAARVAPFLLRRTKEQVAADLPPKTEIVRTIEIAGPQRDLYEAIRLSMQERVRAEIAAKGLARSHIVILDALLKLRQVCCDPRLVKLGSARAVKGSAKLELLTEMLPELVDEGRRVLVFSQFTQMLALIEKELTRLGIAYVLLTGTTEDRATPVRRFQAGEVPVFLISLKAGGTGLNLTAADTVIHYDPWWNPAAEDQASDRAHRIGQEKPVFVYKLYTEGTVEEKIRDLQVRKRALVESILTERDSAPQLAEDDLDALFAPL